jgi:putative endonuclease
VKGRHLHYVYLLESVGRPGQRYVGQTGDLKSRLKEHNAGKSAYAANLGPGAL